MELSIVLVIIGLLVGGILAGADLIKAAKLNKVISEREQIMTAMNTFYLKYNCIPGDCYNISTYLSGETNGDGDETIDHAAAASATGEMFTFWKQLAAAGLYPGSYTGLNGSGHASYDGDIGINLPISKAISKAGYSFAYYPAQSGYAGMYDGKYGNVLWFGKEYTNDLTVGAALKPVDAYTIDKKVDDGKPGTGKIRPWVDISSCSSPSDVVTSPSTSAYYISNNSIACRLMFLLDY